MIVSGENCVICFVSYDEFATSIKLTCFILHLHWTDIGSMHWMCVCLYMYVCVCVCVCVCLLYNSPSTPRPRKRWGQVWQITFFFHFHLSLICFLSPSSHPPWFEQIIKALIIKFFPFYCYFVPSISIFSSVLISQRLQIPLGWETEFFIPAKRR